MTASSPPAPAMALVGQTRTVSGASSTAGEAQVAEWVRGRVRAGERPSAATVAEMLGKSKASGLRLVNRVIDEVDTERCATSMATAADAWSRPSATRPQAEPPSICAPLTSSGVRRSPCSFCDPAEGFTQVEGIRNMRSTEHAPPGRRRGPFSVIRRTVNAALMGVLALSLIVAGVTLDSPAAQAASCTVPAMTARTVSWVRSLPAVKTSTAFARRSPHRDSAWVSCRPLIQWVTMPRKFEPEMKTRALRMLAEAMPDHANKTEASRHVGGLLGISPETLRTWARQEAIDAGQVPGVTSDAEVEIRRLKRENASCARPTRSSRPRACFSPRSSTTPRRDDRLHRSDEGSLSGFSSSARVLRPAVSGFLSARGYRAAKARMPSARQLRDDLLVPEVARLHAENYGVYGRRKMHALMRRQGWQVGRDQTARLMKLAGVEGVRRSKRTFTTRSSGPRRQ